jgi:L-asparaginase
MKMSDAPDVIGRTKRIAVIATGGTIAQSVAARAGRAHLAASEMLDPASLPAGIEMLPIDLFDLPSPAIGLVEMVKLSRAIDEALAAGAYGVVVTHGTDTLEESAYCVDLCHVAEHPAVFTGAMRPAGLPGADGALNLRDALTVAAHPGARKMGALVVMAGEIHSAQDVRKQHSVSVGAFKSGEHGLLGRVDEGHVHWARRPLRARPLRPPRLDARVEAVKCYAGMGDALLRAATASGVDAIVVEAMGSGQVPPAVMPALRDALTGGVLVVVSSRCGEGPLLRDHYGLPFHEVGDERELLAAGALFCELPGTKARIKTIVGLSAGLSRQELAAWL